MTALRVLQVNRNELWGGAARAANRLHHAMRRRGVDSIMCVSMRKTPDWTVYASNGLWNETLVKLRPRLVRLLLRLFKTSNPSIHSPAVISSGWPRRLERLKPDLVHLHWVNDEMMSIFDIGQLHTPLVWTLHDMWAFCGAEHYTEDYRWRDGYTKSNRPLHEGGFDLNRWTWLRKCRAWKRQIQIVTPSHWLANCARKSILMRDWPVNVIPNALDTALYRPHNRAWCREVLGLPKDKPLVLFGAIGGIADPRKGFDLMAKALHHLTSMSGFKDVHCVICGQSEPKDPPQLCTPVRWMGHLSDEWSLVLLYNAVDVVVVPSRQENLPQSGTEAQSCGTPVVAFNCTGLPDTVRDRETGYLADPYSAEDLAKGIAWVLSDENRYHSLSSRARENAVARYSPASIAEQYIAIYELAINEAIR